jgi:hypothetical protein
MQKPCGSFQSNRNIEREGHRRIARSARDKRPLNEARTHSSLERAERWKLSLSEQSLKPTEERYAEAVISDASLFDAVEIHCIYGFSDSNGRIYEESGCHRIPPSSFSVFAHSTSGGVECCGDFTLRSGALDYANELAKAYQWPMFDCTSRIPTRNPRFIQREALLVMAATLKEGFYKALDQLDPDSEADRPAFLSILQVCRAGLIEIWRQLEASEDSAQLRVEASNGK